MTVAELIEQLEKFPPDAGVLIGTRGLLNEGLTAPNDKVRPLYLDYGQVRSFAIISHWTWPLAHDGRDELSIKSMQDGWEGE